MPLLASTERGITASNSAPSFTANDFFMFISPLACSTDVGEREVGQDCHDQRTAERTQHTYSAIHRHALRLRLGFFYRCPDWHHEEEREVDDATDLCQRRTFR